jgi:hypothetical protein
MRPCLIALTFASSLPLLLADSPVQFAKQHLTNRFFSEGVAVADVNQDGHPDVIAGPFAYFGPEFTKKRELGAPHAFDPHSYSNAFIMDAHDFDADDLPDILRIGWPGRAAHWLKNPGKKGGDWAEFVVHPTVGTESPQLLDLVGDNALELIFSADKKLGWASPAAGAPPDAPWQFHPVTPEAHWQRYTHGIGAGDINSDGRTDLITSTGWYEQPASLDGDPMWPHHPADFGPAGAQMYAYDVNADGLNDIITSIHAHQYGVSWFEQKRSATGDTTWIDHPLISREPGVLVNGLQFSQPHAVVMADIDGDGLTDIVTGKRYWAHGPDGDVDSDAPAVIYWFRLIRDENGARYEPHLVDDASGVGTQFTVADLNHDHRLDIITSNKAGVFVFRQTP